MEDAIIRYAPVFEIATLASFLSFFFVHVYDAYLIVIRRLIFVEKRMHHQPLVRPLSSLIALNIKVKNVLPLNIGRSCGSVTQMAPTTWDGNASQEQLMHKDECILVNDKDEITGHGSKYDAHRFSAKNPSGLLHRAFSVFLFDSQNRLLLQRRALSKITFPGVWTNTCCSHPLYGYIPTEVDTPEDVSSGNVPGAKRAAVRKLNHELGIATSTDINFKFLTRLHYCAKDDSGGMQKSKEEQPWDWGEHEMDYILLGKCVLPKDQEVELSPNPDEVMDTRYVTPEELRSMMHPGSGCKWSPWFRIIAENFLFTWWRHLDDILDSSSSPSPPPHADYDSIHRITTTSS